ncbi:hypothetical protein PCC7424_3957 [Gloeothece citriformis PCC 7424]|uniref:Uncharacterized protein n=1 Tax=Gloeothece citriformis (strain PCC 7424) TaxID=65393 RepID=B7KKJ8_GLOC7|nr:hypothetical protein [Gloeothece citriformis]ACK72331.1 hypothetical protein PCC7424_3957 [Gloeothece citriformis PCC 7424]
MERTLYQLTVLAASGGIMLMALSVSFSPTPKSIIVESDQPIAEITEMVADHKP